MQTMVGLYGCYSTATATTKITFARPRDMGALQNVQCSMSQWCHLYCIDRIVVIWKKKLLWPHGTGMSENLNGLSEN